MEAGLASNPAILPVEILPKEVTTLSVEFNRSYPEDHFESGLSTATASGGQNILDWFKQKYQEAKRITSHYIRPNIKPEIGKSKNIKR